MGKLIRTILFTKVKELCYYNCDKDIKDEVPNEAMFL